MIQDFSEVCSRVADFKLSCEQPEASFPSRVHRFGDALDETLRQVSRGKAFVDVLLSGGVDSSLGTACASEFCTVRAHTFAHRSGHPDLIHAKRLALCLGIHHVEHLVQPTELDVALSRDLLGTRDRADNYLVVCRVLQECGVTELITFDGIDELACGYYAHQDGPDAFVRFMEALVPNHLRSLHLASSHYGILVHEPYCSVAVMRALQNFTFTEQFRKRAVYTLAEERGMPPAILERKKFGLVSAFTATPLTVTQREGDAP